jgi:molybdate/tungstate transport system permease protein
VSFVVNAARDGFEAVDERLENVARSLGATRTEAFLTVTLPLSLPAVVTGAVMAWARAVSEFGAVVIIAFFPKIIPTLIYEKNIHTGLAESMPIAALLIVICVGIFVIMRTLTAYWKRRNEEEEAAN